MEDIVATYRYGFKRWRIFALLLLCIVGEIFFLWLVLVIIPSDADGRSAGKMRYVAFFAGPIAICIFLAGFVTTFTHRMRITITSSSIIIPKPNWLGFSNKELSIPLNEVTDISTDTLTVKRLAKVKAIQILYSNGKFKILDGMLDSRKAFLSLHEELVVAVEKSKKEDLSK